MRTFFIFIFLCFGIGANGQFEDTFGELNKKWINAFNSSSAQVQLTDHYFSESALFIDGKMIQGASKIAAMCDDLKEKNGPFKTFKSAGLEWLKKNEVFQLGTYTTSDPHTNYASVIAWINKEGVWKKELEILYQLNDQKATDFEGIDAARKKWVELSNSHDHEKLINEVYTKDAIYFSSFKISAGRSEIIPRYAYMSKPTWSIELFKRQQLSVKSDVVFEVGMYQSGGQGLYVIVWEKVNDAWQAAFDFNF